MSTPAKYVTEMEPIEARYTRAVHDLYCEDGGPHELEAHEPFDGIDDPSEVVPWVDVVAALARRGLLLVPLDTA